MGEATTIALVALAYVFAGFVKGVVGLGLPTVTVAILVPTLELSLAVALTVLPALITNVWQALAGGHAWALLKRLWPLLLTAVVGTLVGTRILASADGDILVVVLGTVLASYAAYALLTRPIPSPGRFEPILAPVTGFFAGLMAGMVGSFTLPGVVYLQALRLHREMLVQALGMVFLTLSLTLGAGLAVNALLDGERLLLSAFAVLPALAGMEIGRRIRRRLSEQRFRTVLLVALLLLGLNMIRTSLT